MPLMLIKTNVILPEKQCEALLAPLSKLLAEITHKPEAYCMVACERTAMLFGGKPGPAALRRPHRAAQEGTRCITRPALPHLHRSRGDELGLEWRIVRLKCLESEIPTQRTHPHRHTGAR